MTIDSLLSLEIAAIAAENVLEDAIGTEGFAAALVAFKAADATAKAARTGFSEADVEFVIDYALTVA